MSLSLSPLYRSISCKRKGGNCYISDAVYYHSRGVIYLSLLLKIVLLCSTCSSHSTPLRPNDAVVFLYLHRAFAYSNHNFPFARTLSKIYILYITVFPAKNYCPPPPIFTLSAMKNFNGGNKSARISFYFFPFVCVCV